MKILSITAPDEPVIIRLVDSTTGNPIVEKALYSGETHGFVVEDGVFVEQIEALTPDPSSPGG